MISKTDRETAFEALVARNKDFLWHICSDYSLSAAWETEDAFQEVLCVLWRDFEMFENRSAERTWIYRVATNCMLMIKRKFSNQPTVDIPAMPEEATTDNENYDALMQLIEALDEKDRLVVRAHLDGFKNHEIADMTGSTAASTAMRLSRAKAKLRKQYNTLISNK